MVRRAGAILFLVLGAYLAAVGITLGATIISSLFQPWLGLEPEILIPIAICLVAAFLLWIGMKLWKQAKLVSDQ